MTCDNRMPTISAIKPHKKDPNRCTISVDSEYSFSISGDLVIKKNLKVNREIDDETLHQIKHESMFQNAKERALHYLAGRSRSENDIRRSLNSFQPEIIERVIDFLRTYNFLDDLDYARRYAKDRLKMKPRSLRLIGQELKSKGIMDQDLELVLSELQDQTDEFSLALELANKKLKSYRHLDRMLQQRRLYHFLRRRGFSSEIISDVLGKLNLFSVRQD